jgi:threonine dehydratase
MNHTTTPDETTLSVTLADIEAARERLGARLPRTPVIASPALGKLTNTVLTLKAENLQRTGSFKVRGALNAVLQLSPEAKHNGVVTFSAGNHGQGLAYAAQRAGIQCTVFMMHTAVQSKVDAIRGYGAETRHYPSIQDAANAMERVRQEQGAVFVSPFADPAIIAGQGVVGLELLEDAPDVEQIIVPIGGGGLIAGVAVAIKALKPEVRIVGVEPVGAPTLQRALEAGHPVTLGHIETIADGLAAPFTEEINLRIIQQLVDDVVLVTDDEIATAMRAVLERTKLLVEPAGAAAIAALLTGKAAVPTGSNTVAILSGGNVDLERLKSLL